MSASGQKLVCLEGLNLDVAPQYLKATQARYVKNLYYQLSDLGDAGTQQGANTGVLKPLPSNQIYCPINLPTGNNHVIGTYSSRETNELYVLVYNSENNHLIFVIDAVAVSCTIVKIDPCFDFKLEPQYFAGAGQIYLEVIYLTDPLTGKQIIKKDLYWTLGINYQGYLRIGDSIATNGFDEISFPYFKGDYDRCTLVRMGLPTPNDCIKINEQPFNPLTDIGINNNLKFTTWQFRILNVDVFGRPSEHGIISDLFYLSNNECLGASDLLSRCVNLTFDAGNPLIDKIQIEYRNCNDEQWYLDSVLELYQGSNLGEWWLRKRNPDVVFDPQTNKITYTFCKDKLCDPIAPTETNRTENPQPRTSQALTKIGRNIVLADNVDRFPPFSRGDILDKITVEVIKPVPSLVGDTANITIWIMIYNPIVMTFQKVWKRDDKYFFGGIANNKGATNTADYDQYFAVEGQKGYLGYLAGTNNYAIGEQYYVDANNKFIKDIDFTENNSLSYFLKFEFNGVPKGNYIFRLASQLANPNDGDIRLTSTTIGGVWNLKSAPFNFSNIVGTQKSYFKELIINACDKDYDTFTSGEILLAYDITRPIKYPDGLTHSNDTVAVGYVYERLNPITLLPETPVELLELNVVSHGHGNINSTITDHNGFWWEASIANVVTVRINGYCECVKKELIRCSPGTGFKVYAFDGKNNPALVIGNPNNGSGIVSSCANYETSKCNRVYVEGLITLCDSGTPIPNINVVLSRGGMGVTDSQGKFRVLAHDGVITNSRGDQLYVIGGGCAFTACNGGCIEVRNVLFAPCNVCTDIERTVDIGSYEVLFISSRGLLSNGRYGIELTGYDWLGRHGFAQTTDKLYFNTPSLNESKTFGFPTVNVIIPQTVTFSDWVDYYTIGITKELTYGGNYIEWIADKVLFVDNAGIENISSPTQIKIYYSSLNEYNTKNNFNTTTGWVIIPESKVSPRTSDVVQFIRNGDGEFFDKPISALIKYDQEGQYFLINYIDSLKGLKGNALIRLANPEDCANKDSFFELCGKYKVINNKSVVNKITLNAFDTYYQYRQIPVPVTTGEGANAVTIIELRQFGFPFEHPSVTDTFGYKCQNIGRFNVRNPYEAELNHLDQVAISGALSVNGQLNYLNYFEEAKKVDFNINNTGGIVALIVKTGIVFFICQYKNYSVGYGDNIARLSPQNIIQVPSGDDTFGKPERAVGGDYGCQVFDKNTISEKDNETLWLDRNMVAVLHNGVQSSGYVAAQQTTDISRYNPNNSTIVSWLVQKIKYQNDFNKKNNNKRYFHGEINPTNIEYLISEFTIGSSDYVNEEVEENVTKHETISFGIVNKVWKAYYSPTPEKFGYLGQILFSFKNGVPYSHDGLDFNTFFGIKCKSVYRFIFNTDGFKKKKFQSLWVYCVQQLLWSDLILTETQQSRLLKSQFKKHDNFYSSGFLCDINTPSDPNTPQVSLNKITDGNNLFGSYLDVRLIGDDNGKYFELYGVIVFAVGEEQSGTG